MPRIQYKRIYNVIPQDADEERAKEIFLHAWGQGKQTVGFSFDDSGIMDLEDKTAVLWDIPEDQHQIYLDWYAEHYPGTQVIFKNGDEESEIIDIVDQLPLAYPRYSRQLHQINAIAIHHFASNNTIQQVHAFHKSRGWPGIAYHFVIDLDGKIYQTIPLDKLGTHVAGHNTRSIGIALRGNYQLQPPSHQMLESAKWLIEHLSSILSINEVQGHRHFSGNNTACPGNTCCPGWLDYLMNGAFKFHIGDQIQTTTNLNVRETPGGTIIGSQSPNVMGTVVDGPGFANGLTWWKVDYNSPPSGWSAENWLEYPVTEYESKIGLHASADPGHLSNEEIQEFATLQPDVIKVLSAHSRESIETLRHHHDVTYIVRAFLEFGGRHVTPQQFFEWTVEDVARSVQAVGKQCLIELHNEPNLVAEGWTTSWADGFEFSEWYIQVLNLYKSVLSDHLYMYPGLSPGESIPGIRTAHRTFLQQSSSAVNASNALGIHEYWQSVPDTPWPIELAISNLGWYDDRYTNIWVTEASNNGYATPEQKASQYLQFYNSLKQFKNVKGVTYFVASASNPNWRWDGGSRETWVDVGMAQLVRDA